MSITKISTVEVGAGGAASIDFNSISGSFTDLMIVLSSRTAVSDNGLRMKVNGATSNLSTRLVYGNGSGIGNATETTYIGATSNSTSTANTFGNAIIYITNYAGTAGKSFSADLVSENNGTSATQFLTAGLYNSSTAITSLSFVNDAGGNFAQYSSATLYGVLKGSSGGVTVS